MEIVTVGILHGGERERERHLDEDRGGRAGQTTAAAEDAAAEGGSLLPWLLLTTGLSLCAAANAGPGSRSLLSLCLSSSPVCLL